MEVENINYVINSFYNALLVVDCYVVLIQATGANSFVIL